MLILFVLLKVQILLAQRFVVEAGNTLVSPALATKLVKSFCDRGLICHDLLAFLFLNAFMLNFARVRWQSFARLALLLIYGLNTSLLFQ